MKRALPLLLLLVAVAVAQHYRLPEWVIDEGGTEMTSPSGGNYIQHGSFHQTTIGRATSISGNMIGWIGYWHPRLFEIIHDVGVIEILRPPATMRPDTVTPIAVISNYGIGTETFDVHFRILDGTDTTYRGYLPGVMLDAGETTQVTFTTTSLDTGTYGLIAWTDLVSDQNPANDRRFDTTIVALRDHDVGVVAIVSPPLRVRTTNITPKAYVHNYGINTETFWTHFHIFDSTGVQEYHDSVLVSALPPGTNTDPAFATVTLTEGWHEARCSTALVSDVNPQNDTAYIRFLVGVWGWFQTTDVPLGSRARRVNHGGCITWVPPKYIYGLKGNRTTDFMRFDVDNQSWQMRESIPRPPWRWRSRAVKKGAALCYNGADVVYAVKGYNTTEFWKYSVGGDSWTELESVPRGVRGKRIKYGSGLAFHPKGDSSFVWLLKGANTTEFLGYWIEGDTWIFHTNAPAGRRRKRYKAGSCVTTDNNGHVFALKARYNEFYRYDIQTDYWDTLMPMPFDLGGHRRKVKDGGALCYAGGDTIYAFKGGNTWQFYRYDITQDTWIEDEPIGLGPSLKRVKRGGSLAWCPTQRRVYAFKGNRTFEFWYFVPTPSWVPAGTPPRPTRSGVAAAPPVDFKGLRIVPTMVRDGWTHVELSLARPSRLDLLVTDVAGRVVHHQTGVPVDRGRHRLRVNLTALPRGVYLMLTDLKSTDGNRTVATHKLIVSH